MWRWCHRAWHGSWQRTGSGCNAGAGVSYKRSACFVVGSGGGGHKASARAVKAACEMMQKVGLRKCHVSALGGRHKRPRMLRRARACHPLCSGACALGRFGRVQMLSDCLDVECTIVRAGGGRGCKCADNANMTWPPIIANRNGLAEFRDHDRWDGTDLGHRDESGRWLVRSPCTSILPTPDPCPVPYPMARAYRSIPHPQGLAIMSHPTRSATVRPAGAPANSPTVLTSTMAPAGTVHRPTVPAGTHTSTMLAAACAPS